MGAKSNRNIPERFLRQIWNYQLIATDNLLTTKGQQIDILSPGELNQDSGPDFLDARVRIGGLTFCGNIELHQSFSGWNDHQHHLNPLYNAVILHVVFYKGADKPVPRTKSKRQIPVLVLEEYLSTSYRDLWEKMIVNERTERLPYIRCYSKNDNVDGYVLRQWLQKLAAERVELKVRRYEERLKELIAERRLQIAERPSRYDEPPFGINPEDLPSPEPQFTQRDFTQLQPWEQILYEGIMEALGYAKNHLAMVKLARNINLNLLISYAKRSGVHEATTRIEAALFHAGGLLSVPLTSFDKESREYVKHLRKTVVALQPPYHNQVMHPTEWKFFRLRPENFPTLRLAGAARLIPRFNENHFLKTIIQHLKDDSIPSDIKYTSLQEMFIVSADGFWETHYRFGERAAAQVHTLIGKSRADDIILNVVLPISLLYARIFKEGLLRRRALKLFEECPVSASNTILTTIQIQLVKEKTELDSAMLQQGALQLYKMYCLKERCRECMVGKSVFNDQG
jgi:hypothetical protein